jgi:hypothetical protein
MLFRFNMQQLVNTLWSLSVVQQPVRPATLDAMAAVILGKIQEATPQNLSNCLYSMARLNHNPLYPRYCNTLVKQVSMQHPGCPQMISVPSCSWL